MNRAAAIAAVIAAIPLVAGNSQVSAQSARDYVSIVGSSTVYPFATVVAEQFGKTSDFKTPKIESTGSGGGLKLFCAGVGVEHPDITNTSRRIKQSEVELCEKNGVTDVVEVKVGYDGIVMANSKASAPFALTLGQVYLALAKDVPDPGGAETLVANPYKMWSHIDDSLPNERIEVLGPPPTSGTRDAFVELAMEGGCKSYDFIKSMEKADFKAACHTMREDGAFVEAGENDNLIVQKLGANPTALGIFGFSFLDQNLDKLHGAAVDGVDPTFEDIASGDYPVSRPLYFYAKTAHIGVIPGIEEFMTEFASDKAWGDEGYLTDKGLIPMPEEEREKFKAAVENKTNVDLSS